MVYRPMGYLSLQPVLNIYLRLFVLWEFNKDIEIVSDEQRVSSLLVDSEC